MTGYPTSFACFNPAAPTMRGLAEKAVAMHDARRDFRDYFLSLVATGELVGASWHETDERNLYSADEDEWEFAA